MRSRQFLSIVALSFVVLLLVKCKEKPMLRTDRIVLIVDSLSIASNNAILNFYNKDLFLQSILLRTSPAKVIFANTTYSNEIVFKDPSGKDWTFFAKGGDSLRLEFIDDTLDISVLNRESKKWDQNFELLSSKTLWNGKSDPYVDYKYLERSMNDPYSGMSDNSELAAELQRLKTKAKSGFDLKNALIDSLLNSNLISPEAAQYYVQTNRLNERTLSLDKNDHRALMLVLSEILQSDTSKAVLRSSEFQSLLEICAVSLVSSDSASQVVPIFNSLSDFPFTEDLVIALRIKVASHLYDKLSEDKRKHLVETIRQKSSLKQAENLSALYPSAEIFSIGLSFKNDRGEDVSSDMVLSSHIGRKVYVDLWAGWCGPCILELPKLNELSKKYSGKVDVIYLSIDRDIKSWQRAVKTHFEDNYSDSYYLDNVAQEVLLQHLKISSIPRYILFDESGVLIHSNAPRPHDPDLEQLLTKMP